MKDIRYDCKCNNCNHAWSSRYNNQPKVCPKCKSPMITLKAERRA